MGIMLREALVVFNADKCFFKLFTSSEYLLDVFDREKSFLRYFIQIRAFEDLQEIEALLKVFFRKPSF